MYGEYEAIEEDESVTESLGGGRSRTRSAKRVRRKAVMPSQFTSIPMPSPEAGLTFYAITTSLGAYRETMSGEAVARALMPANADPAQGGMVNSDPVPADRQVLRPWDAADYARLKMTPPADKPAQGEQPGQDPEGPPQGRKRKKFRVVRGARKRVTSE